MPRSIVRLCKNSQCSFARLFQRFSFLLFVVCTCVLCQRRSSKARKLVPSYLYLGSPVFFHPRSNRLSYCDVFVLPGSTNGVPPSPKSSKAAATTSFTAPTHPLALPPNTARKLRQRLHLFKNVFKVLAYDDLEQRLKRMPKSNLLNSALYFCC